MGSCLTLGSEWSEETHGLTTQEAPLGRDTWSEGRRVKGAQEKSFAMWRTASGFLVTG